MKVAMVTLIRPYHGSGDGITEYTYQIYNKLKGKMTIDFICPLEKVKHHDTLGLIYANSIFKNRIKKLASMDYDVIHITHPELGFAAKILKQSRSRARVVSCIHDLMRLESGFHYGLMQKTYNLIVTKNIKDALDYSDYIIFTSSTVRDVTLKRFPKVRRYTTTLLGTKDYFLAKMIPEKRKAKTFTIGYMGSHVYYKNVIFVLKTALLLKSHKEYRFMVYGRGGMTDSLLAYKASKGLDNVEFPGFAPEDKLLEIYDSFDAFIWPSFGDSSSFPIEDAQARGLPVIIYDKGILDKEVRECSLVARDEKEAARIIINLRQKGFDGRLRKKELDFVRSISWNNTANKTFEVYKKLTGE